METLIKNTKLREKKSIKKIFNKGNEQKFKLTSCLATAVGGGAIPVITTLLAI